MDANKNIVKRGDAIKPARDELCRSITGIWLAINSSPKISGKCFLGNLMSKRCATQT